MAKKREPHDKKQCQTDKPNGCSFMSLDGVPGLVRCTAKPDVIVYELTTQSDGQKGSMSLCNDCLKVFMEQVGIDGYKVESLKKVKAKKKG